MQKQINATEFFEIQLASAQAKAISEVELRSMSTDIRNLLITEWHKEMQLNLASRNEYVDLRSMTAYLKQKIENTSILEILSRNVLLCTAICTLNWMRNGNVPKSSIEVCEKICEVLLNRGNKNYPGTKTEVDDYGKLNFWIRKGLVTKIAYYMITSGVSTITSSEVEKLIAKELPSYNQVNDRHNIKASTIRQALIERSGILQQSNNQEIEFVDDTLKYYLAAQRFVNIGDSQTLADNCKEDSFKQIISFAVDLAEYGSKFTRDLASSIIDVYSKNN